jgi:hypothetical protein
MRWVLADHFTTSFNLSENGSFMWVICGKLDPWNPQIGYSDKTWWPDALLKEELIFKLFLSNSIVMVYFLWFDSAIFRILKVTLQMLTINFFVVVIFLFERVADYLVPPKNATFFTSCKIFTQNIWKCLSWENQALYYLLKISCF